MYYRLRLIIVVMILRVFLDDDDELAKEIVTSKEFQALEKELLKALNY